MKHRCEIISAYAAGMVQGLALVTFPAVGKVLTDPSSYALSGTQYGAMFVPQAVMAVGALLAGTELTGRWGIKRIFLLGLACNLLAMLLLASSRFVMHEPAFAYALLLAATGSLGAGFGFTVPALNTFAAGFFPKKPDGAVLAMNALLGLGTALAPVFVALFVHLGRWWGLPVLVSVLLVALLPVSAGGKFSAVTPASGKAGVPARFWLFASFALLYGVCETMNGNWASLYLSKQLHATATVAALGLAAFWGLVTAGRILFAALAKWLPEQVVGRVLPFVVAGAFLASGAARRPWQGLLAFALAGLGCSALLPMAISFGQKELTAMGASVAGGVIACYQVGYAIAAFGVGPLQSHAGLDLGAIYGGSAVIAVAMAALAIFVTRQPAAVAR